MIISVDYGWNRQIFLVLPVKYLIYLLLKWGILFRRPSPFYNNHLSTSEYGIEKKDNIRILPGELVNLGRLVYFLYWGGAIYLTVWSRYSSNPTLGLIMIWFFFLFYQLFKDT